MVPLSVLIAPPPELRVIPLLLSNSKVVVVFNVPPLKVIELAVVLPGTGPKLVSLLIRKVPPLIFVIPV